MTKTGRLLTFVAAAGMAASTATPAQAQSEPLLGQLMTFAGNFCPRGWARTNGSLLPISQHQALFSILGTAYGGDGRTTFALPDLRGRMVVGPGQMTNGQEYKLGSQGGSETVTLTEAQMPAHSHSGYIRAETQDGTSADPSGTYIAEYEDHQTVFADGPPNADMGPGSIQTNNTGGSQPHPNMSPYVVITVCIATQGQYPSRG